MKKNGSLKSMVEQFSTTIGNLTIKTFHFNFVRVNTYIVYDDTKEAVIIDPGNHAQEENQQLFDFIAKKELTVKYILVTHTHFDHIFGIQFAKEQYQVPFLMHPAALLVYSQAGTYLKILEHQEGGFPPPDGFIEEGEIISFGHQQLEILYVPGHCDGSICLYDPNNKVLFTGDVLFYENLGRTDLPTGDYDILVNGIKEKLLPLEEEVTVFPGHGNTTTIGHEKLQIPYLK
ncbi:MAG: MBL fold metallo-hydrolase [Bacteroidales bacterium]|jgi:glyoxylase-like metal-dependent hydrolase (beta-lactamase superfamily II)|nr:MBL fold metallo-hydrolase [Bacteroidales bacterium]